MRPEEPKLTLKSTRQAFVGFPGVPQLSAEEIEAAQAAEREGWRASRAAFAAEQDKAAAIAELQRLWPFASIRAVRQILSDAIVALGGQAIPEF